MLIPNTMGANKCLSACGVGKRTVTAANKHNAHTRVLSTSHWSRFNLCWNSASWDSGISLPFTSEEVAVLDWRAKRVRTVRKG